MGILTGCTPRPEILKGDLNDSIFAADFGTLVAGNADPVYGVAKTFFANTHPATQLKKVVEVVFERLASPQESGAVVALSTGFGGGKTHTLMALYHLAENIADISLGTELLPAAGRPKKVKVIAIDAGKPESHEFYAHRKISVKSLWGEVFYQMGEAAALKTLGPADDPEGSPSEAQIESVFPKGPTLILLDELVIYMAKLSSRGQGNLLGFVNSLAAIVARHPQTVMIITDPAGQAAYQQETDELKRMALNSAAVKLDEVVGRRASEFDPIGDESAQVIVRRLLTKVDHVAAQQASAAYHNLYQRVAKDHPNLLPNNSINKAYAERIVASYPFHPRLLDTAQDRLGALQDFQKSRGVLRLFARILRDVWEAQTDYDVIGAGEINWSSPRIQADLLHRLNKDNFRAAVTADVESHAGDLDGGAPRGIHRRVASALLLESLPLQNSSGLDPAEATLAVLRLDEAGVEPSEAMERLVGCCWHTYPMASGRGWQFRFDPNIYKQIEERKSQIPIEDARKRLEAEVQSYFTGPTFRVTPWPTSARTVRELPDLQLVLCDNEKTAHWVCANSDDSTPEAPMPRSFINAVVAVAPTSSRLNNAIERAQRLLAAETIERENRSGEHAALVRQQMVRILPELKKHFRIESVRAFDTLVFAGGTTKKLTEKNQVPDELVLQERPHGQKNIMDFLEVSKLIYSTSATMDVDKFMRDVLPGTTPLMDNPEVFTAKAVHERFLSVRGLQLLRDGGIVRQTILKAVDEGKLLVKVQDGRVFDKEGCVEGLEGQRRRIAGSISSIPLDDTVLVTRGVGKTAEIWLKVDPEGQEEGPRKPLRKKEGRITVRGWDQAVESASTRPLVQLRLKAITPSAAQQLIPIAQPLSANALSMEVSLSGEVKDGGTVNLIVSGIHATHQMKPLEIAQKLHTSLKEGCDFQADLLMEFGAAGRAGLAEQLKEIADKAPNDISPEALFEEPTGTKS